MEQKNRIIEIKHGHVLVSGLISCLGLKHVFLEAQKYFLRRPESAWIYWDLNIDSSRGYVHLEHQAEIRVVSNIADELDVLDDPKPEMTPRGVRYVVRAW